jgi:hypothetical protein
MVPDVHRNYTESSGYRSSGVALCSGRSTLPGGGQSILQHHGDRIALTLSNSLGHRSRAIALQSVIDLLGQ